MQMPSKADLNSVENIEAHRMRRYVLKNLVLPYHPSVTATLRLVTRTLLAVRVVFDSVPLEHRDAARPEVRSSFFFNNGTSDRTLPSCTNFCPHNIKINQFLHQISIQFNTQTTKSSLQSSIIDHALKRGGGW